MSKKMKEILKAFKARHVRETMSLTFVRGETSTGRCARQRAKMEE